MIELKERIHTKEFLDDLSAAPSVLRETYEQIRNINLCTGGYWPTLSAVKYFLSRYGQLTKKITILDIGCGDGETLRRIDRYCKRLGLSLDLIGIDTNALAIETARDKEPLNAIDFIRGNIFSNAQNKVYDIIITSLTMHHLNDEEIIMLIRWMTDHVRIGWFVSDLHRSHIAYYFIKYFVKCFGFNPLICHDAPLSVARSFRRKEWIHFLTQAELDLDFIKISWYPNFRYGIRYEKLL